jgi:hypothetical protein
VWTCPFSGQSMDRSKRHSLPNGAEIYAVLFLARPARYHYIKTAHEAFKEGASFCRQQSYMRSDVSVWPFLRALHITYPGRTTMPFAKRSARLSASLFI